MIYITHNKFFELHEQDDDSNSDDRIYINTDTMSGIQQREQKNEKT